jgi:hypothetical protein
VKVIDPRLRQAYHVIFCFPPTFEIIERANYRVRSSLTVSFPTDVSDRNPRSSIFVEPSGDNDERIFGEQIGHAAPCSSFRSSLTRFFKPGQMLDSLQHAATGYNAPLIVSHMTIQNALLPFQTCAFTLPYDPERG